MKESWLSIAMDPNHIIAELVWTLLFDVVIVAFLYGFVWKKLLFPKFHIKFDIDHGLSHDKVPPKIQGPTPGIIEFRNGNNEFIGLITDQGKSKIVEKKP